MAYYLRQKYPNISLVIGHFGNGSRIARVLAESLGVPMIATFGGSDVNVEWFKDQHRAAYQELLEIPSAHFLTVAGYLRDKLLQYGAPPERLFTWHRGVNLDDFELVTRPPPGPDRPVRMVMAARFYEVKGHDYMIRAVAQLKQRGRRAELILLGDGPLEEPLRKLAAELGVGDEVKFLGRVDHREVMNHLRTADIYVHPSVTCGEGRVEGVPNAVMEAHATGLPVVATIHGGIPEVCLDGETGFLVPERDADALAARVGQLIDSRELRVKMGLAGRAHVEREFNLAVQSRRLAGRIHHAIEAADLFSLRGWPLGRRADEPFAAPPSAQGLDGEGLLRTLARPVFPTHGKRFGSVVRLYKLAVWHSIFRPYLRFVGRELSRFVEKELSAQSARLVSTVNASIIFDRSRRNDAAADEATEQRMSTAACLDCPHCPAGEPWPDAICPMDRACLETLQREFVPLGALKRPRPAAAHHYEGDLQRVADVPDLLRDLRRRLAPGDVLELDVWPLPRGRDGARLHGDLAVPFAQYLFTPEVLASFLGRPLQPLRDFDADDLRRWAAEAGLAIRAEEQPPRHDDPAEMHVQARFAVLLRRAGLARRQIARAFVATLEPVAAIGEKAAVAAKAG